MNPVRNTKPIRVKNKISNGVKIIIRNFQRKIPLSQKKINRTAHKVLSSLRPKKQGFITICFVDEKKIKELNLKYLKKFEATDVLSFDLTQTQAKSKEIIADVVISVDAACKNSKIYKTTLWYELNLYVIHGLLHLFGFDDITEAKRRKMNRRANQILQTLKIK